MTIACPSKKYLGWTPGNARGAIESVCFRFFTAHGRTWSTVPAPKVTTDLGSLCPHSMPSLVCGHRLWLVSGFDIFHHVSSCFMFNHFMSLLSMVPIWLVLWNIYFSTYWECHHPISSQLTNSYFSESFKPPTSNRSTPLVRRPQRTWPPWLEDPSWHFYWTLFWRDRITSCRSPRRHKKIRARKV